MGFNKKAQQTIDGYILSGERKNEWELDCILYTVPSMTHNS